MPPKSNTVVVFPLLAAAFVAAILVNKTDLPEETKNRVCLILFSSFFWAPALAQIRSGYRWKNMSPGNRGPHKSEELKKYKLSVAGNCLLAALMVCLAFVIR
jgi:hypothetical protein